MTTSFRILLTNDTGYPFPGVVALRDAFIRYGMNVLTVVPAASDACGVSEGGPRMPATDSIVHIDGEASDCVRFALRSGIVERSCLVVHGIDDGWRFSDKSVEPTGLQRIAEAATGGGTVLGVYQEASGLPRRSSQASSANRYAWAAELAVEFAALMLWRPPPIGSVITINVPNKRSSLLPVLTETDARCIEAFAASQPDRVFHSRLTVPRSERDTLYAGRVAMTATQRGNNDLAAGSYVRAWAVHALNALAPRFGGERQPCACCA